MATDTTSELNETARRLIRAKLTYLGLSQADLAIRLGWSRMYVSHRLSGSVLLSLSDLEAIANGLGVPIGQLLAVQA